MTKVYNKLVRDKIPEIIVMQGNIPKTEVLDDAAYFQALNAKLQEEVAEYLEAFCVEEIADVLEVIHAIIAHKGLSYAEVEQIREDKNDARGGFCKKISLVEVECKE